MSFIFMSALLKSSWKPSTPGGGERKEETLLLQVLLNISDSFLFSEHSQVG